MDVIVLVKQVPSTQARITLTDDRKGIGDTDIDLVVNPYDEYAIEEALKIRSTYGGTTTLVTVGAARAEEALRFGLAMGADEGAHVILPDPTEDYDANSVACALVRVLRGMEYDLILGGKEAVDDGNGQVMILLAEYLDLPHVSAATGISFHEDLKAVTVDRPVEGGVEVLRCTLPAVLTAEKGLNEPRYPSLPGIMKAKRKPVQSLSDDVLDLADRRLELLGLELAPSRTAGERVEGEPEQLAQACLDFLKGKRVI